MHECAIGRCGAVLLLLLLPFALQNHQRPRPLLASTATCHPAGTLAASVALQCEVCGAPVVTVTAAVTPLLCAASSCAIAGRGAY